MKTQGKKNEINARLSPLALLSKPFNSLCNLLAPRTSIDLPPPQTHADFLIGIGLQQPLEQQMAHVQADKHAAVAAVFLYGRVVQMHKLDGPVEEGAELACRRVRFPVIPGRQRVVVEGHPVHDGDQQQRPVRAALGFGDVAAVVDREEDVGGAREVGQGFAQRKRIGRL